MPCCQSSELILSKVVCFNGLSFHLLPRCQERCALKTFFSNYTSYVGENVDNKASISSMLMKYLLGFIRTQFP